MGEEDDALEEIEEYRTKINKIDMPEEVREKALKELDRLDKMNPHSAENISNTYLFRLDYRILLDVETKDKVNIKEARNVLNKDRMALLM